MPLPSFPVLLVRAALAAALAAAAADARADDGPPPPPPEAGGAGDVQRPDAPEGDTWIDAGHEAVEDVIGMVLRLDRFFSDETALEPIREKSFVRWRNDVRTTQDDDFQYVGTLRANLRFPGLSRERLRVIVGEAAAKLPRR